MIKYNTPSHPYSTQKPEGPVRIQWLNYCNCQHKHEIIPLFFREKHVSQSKIRNKNVCIHPETGSLLRFICILNINRLCRLSLILEQTEEKKSLT